MVATLSLRPRVDLRFYPIVDLNFLSVVSDIRGNISNQKDANGKIGSCTVGGLILTIVGFFIIILI